MSTHAGWRICLILAALAARAAAHPELPGAPQRRPVALVGGTIHPVAGPPLAEGTLLFAEGRITFVGRDPKLPADAELIDVRGKHVYPGLIDAATELGLVEIPSVRAARDTAETGPINPNVRAEAAFNPDSELIPVARANGVLTVLSAPQGPLVQGMSAVMQLDGWTAEDMTLRAPYGLHVNWPAVFTPRGWRLDPAARPEPKRRDENLLKLRETFDLARAYAAARRAAPADTPAPIDLRLETLLPVLDGKIPLVARANDLDQIQGAVGFAAREGVRLVILGGYDAPHAAELLKRHRVGVIVGGVHRLPMRRHEPYDEPFTVPARLQAAGVPFAIASDAWGSHVRNLPYHAATAVAHGLPAAQGLRSITLSAAELLGVADRIGSLEVGKDATILVTTGDPLEAATQVNRAWIQGRPLSLTNRHTRLFDKYREKLDRLERKP